jgi:phospholipid/cholesterol/gamma-HCH transport system permease protein
MSDQRPLAPTDARGDRPERVMSFSGRLDIAVAGKRWASTVQAARAADGHVLVLDLSALDACDTAGAALLLAVQRAHRGESRIDGASEHVAAVLARTRLAIAAPAAPPAPAVVDWGAFGRRAVLGAADGVAFLGEALLAALRPAGRHMVRLREVLHVADEAGVRALPLTLLLGVLIGLILAFQSAVPMRRFGADLYVANLVSISLLRELGPLLTAVILAGRTGSAFAAEIGTMKVNEELDALATMGLDPMTMLVLPRLAGVMLVMPALTMTLNLAGLFGMAVVMAVLGYPPVAVADQVIGAVAPPDLYGGLFKAMVFGAAVAAIGCHCGMQTGNGPRAVGLAATAAVVGGIVATILLDGTFAILFYRIGL